MKDIFCIGHLAAERTTLTSSLADLQYSSSEELLKRDTIFAAASWFVADSLHVSVCSYCFYGHYRSLAHLPRASSVRVSFKTVPNRTADDAQSVQILRLSRAAMRASLAECGFQHFPLLLPLAIPMLDMAEFVMPTHGMMLDTG